MDRPVECARRSEQDRTGHGELQCSVLTRSPQALFLEALLMKAKLPLIASSALALGFLLGWRFEWLSSHAEAGVAPGIGCDNAHGHYVRAVRSAR